MALLRSLFYAYKQTMINRSFFSASIISAIVLFGTDVSASFNGEVLVAPPPPNWSGGIVEQTTDGTLQVWRRTFNNSNGVTETISIRRSALPESPDVQVLADSVKKRISDSCQTFTETKRTPVTAKIGSALSFTLTCKPKSAAKQSTHDLFVRVRVMTGEFNQYVIERAWRGDIKQPTSPANSPRTRASWQAFFSSSSICNTLVSDCSDERARDIHAHERFKKMRALPAVARSVMPAGEIAKVAKGLGELTGRADACGEDISPLTSKIDRMFAYISENDQISSAAVDTFNATRKSTLAAQGNLPREQCGEILRTFRSHPSRVGVFHKYAQRFL